MKQFQPTSRYWEFIKKKLLLLLKSRNNRYLFLIFVFSFILFYPSLFNFYTHDDFFHLKISRVDSLSDFIGFFNIFVLSKTNASFRPISTQVFYYFGQLISVNNPFWMHVILFVLFFAIIYLVYYLIKLLTKNEKAAILSAFFYGISSTHFGQLYYLATQELWWTFFALFCLVLFVKYLRSKKISTYLLSTSAFLLSLMSKESAVVIPPLIILIYSYLKIVKHKIISIKSFIKVSIPLFGILFVYLYLHIYKYGMQGGESYIWDFSPRVFNSLFWYGIWSLNFPEMLVDFIGPGLKINSAQLLYWRNYLYTILFSSMLLGTIIVFRIKDFVKNANKNDYVYMVFCIFLFIFGLVPVLFLPWHKFTYYLTLPLVGIVGIIAYILTKAKIHRILFIAVLVLWTTSSISNLQLTKRTNWITQGANIAEKIYNYINFNYRNVEEGKAVLFYDEKSDYDLPWSPSGVIKSTLSDNNFFLVFFPNIKAYYGQTDVKNPDKIYSRQFLGY